VREVSGETHKHLFTSLLNLPPYRSEVLLEESIIKQTKQSPTKEMEIEDGCRDKDSRDPDRNGIARADR
jgi:hypothetical protein